MADSCNFCGFLPCVSIEKKEKPVDLGRRQVILSAVPVVGMTRIERLCLSFSSLPTMGKQEEAETRRSRFMPQLFLEKLVSNSAGERARLCVCTWFSSCVSKGASNCAHSTSVLQSQFGNDSQRQISGFKLNFSAFPKAKNVILALYCQAQELPGPRPWMRGEPCGQRWWVPLSVRCVPGAGRFGGVCRASAVSAALQRAPGVSSRRGCARRSLGSLLRSPKATWRRVGDRVRLWESGRRRWRSWCLAQPPSSGTRNNSCSGAGQRCDSACVLGLELFYAVSTSETLGGSESC